jgi:hypothetical protein
MLTATLAQRCDTVGIRTRLLCFALWTLTCQVLSASYSLPSGFRSRCFAGWTVALAAGRAWRCDAGLVQTRQL